MAEVYPEEEGEGEFTGEGFDQDMLAGGVSEDLKEGGRSQEERGLDAGLYWNGSHDAQEDA